ncbi:hypothetical protein KIL84_008048 [Mauremys mutica]|uniref:Uncharacterized protein n=1 Tax=Mauremys mutica TaxID=74926 RepID=A0A9D3X4K4_9SAUR|nr:hypothetical protein KIL84_008048 [Mauremys mutica]
MEMNPGVPVINCFVNEKCAMTHLPTFHKAHMPLSKSMQKAPPLSSTQQGPQPHAHQQEGLCFRRDSTKKLPSTIVQSPVNVAYKFTSTHSTPLRKASTISLCRAQR